MAHLVYLENLAALDVPDPKVHLVLPAYLASRESRYMPL